MADSNDFEATGEQGMGEFDAGSATSGQAREPFTQDLSTDNAETNNISINAGHPLPAAASSDFPAYDGMHPFLPNFGGDIHGSGTAQSAQSFVGVQWNFAGSNHQFGGMTSYNNFPAGFTDSFSPTSNYPTKHYGLTGTGSSRFSFSTGHNASAAGSTGSYPAQTGYRSTFDSFNRSIPTHTSSLPPRCGFLRANSSSDSRRRAVDEVEEEVEEEEQNEVGEAEQDDEPDLTGTASQSGGQASSRQSRSRWWPPRSDQHRVYPSIQRRREEVGNSIIELGTGADSGRNRFAVYQDIENPTPRLADNIRVHGRGGAHWQGYSSPQDVVLPVGMSLADMLSISPNHVWNDGLRLFMAEGWSAEAMWRGMPVDARNSGANTRPWNYLQQALGREADKIWMEETGRRRVPEKRSIKEEDEQDDDQEGQDE